MLNFRKTNIIFALLLLLMAAAGRYYQLPAWLYLLAVFAYAGLLFYGSYNVGSNFFIKVLCHAHTSSREIAISFDDGPVKPETPEILHILKTHKVPAVFFCIGKNIDGNEAVLQQIAAEGHIIGNHSYSHAFWFDLFSARKMKEDLQQMAEKVKAVTGRKPLLFRPPYGVTTPNMKKVMRDGGYTAIGWNIRSLDTVIHDEEKLLQKIEVLLQPGAVILLHDTSKTTRDILPALIKLARNKGYEWVRLDTLLNIQPYA